MTEQRLHAVENKLASPGWSSRAALDRLGGLQNLGLVLFLVALVVGFSILSPFFLGVRNLTNMLLSVSVIGTMAAVSTLVLVTRGLDLSVGSIVGLVGVVAATVLEAGFGWGWSLVAGALVGAVCGALNGLIAVKLRINSIIVTIGTLSVFRGVAYVATEGQTLNVLDSVLLDIGAAARATWCSKRGSCRCTTSTSCTARSRTDRRSGAAASRSATCPRPRSTTDRSRWARPRRRRRWNSPTGPSGWCGAPIEAAETTSGSGIRTGDHFLCGSAAIPRRGRARTRRPISSRCPLGDKDKPYPP